VRTTTAVLDSASESHSEELVFARAAVGDESGRELLRARTRLAERGGRDQRILLALATWSVL
jgi:hypothetical protein